MRQGGNIEGSFRHCASDMGEIKRLPTKGRMRSTFRRAPTDQSRGSSAGLHGETRLSKSEDPSLSLNTRVTGQVRECTLADGRARITVALVTANALGFAQSIEEIITNEFDFAGTATILGAKAVDVVAGAAPAKGPVKFTTSFTIEEPGAPLPDFLDVVNTVEYAPASLVFESKTIGRLPDGQRAFLEIEQVATQAEGADWTYSVETVEIVIPGR